MKMKYVYVCIIEVRHFKIIKIIVQSTHTFEQPFNFLNTFALAMARFIENLPTVGPKLSLPLTSDVETVSFSITGAASLSVLPSLRSQQYISESRMAG